jgi:hypothetical protein
MALVLPCALHRSSTINSLPLWNLKIDHNGNYCFPEMLRHVVCEIIIEVSEKPDASIFRVEERRRKSVRRFTFFSALKMEAILSSETSVNTIYDTTSKKTAYFIVTAVKTSNLIRMPMFEEGGNKTWRRYNIQNI